MKKPRQKIEKNKKTKKQKKEPIHRRSMSSEPRAKSPRSQPHTLGKLSTAPRHHRLIHPLASFSPSSVFLNDDDAAETSSPFSRPSPPFTSSSSVTGTLACARGRAISALIYREITWTQVSRTRGAGAPRRVAQRVQLPRNLRYNKSLSPLATARASWFSLSLARALAFSHSLSTYSEGVLTFARSKSSLARSSILARARPRNAQLCKLARS